MCQGEKCIVRDETSTAETNGGINNENFNFSLQNPSLPPFGNIFNKKLLNSEEVKFEPKIASDSMVLKGVQQYVGVKLFCISALKKFEDKSLEELRHFDYFMGRKVISTLFRPSNVEQKQKDNTTSTKTSVNSSINSKTLPTLFATLTAPSLSGGSSYATESVPGLVNPNFGYFKDFPYELPLPPPLPKEFFGIPSKVNGPAPRPKELFDIPSISEESLFGDSTANVLVGEFNAFGLNGQQFTVKDYQKQQPLQSNFVPPILNNTQQIQINEKMMCISAMKNFENKCLEELRFTDYSFGNKLNSKNIFYSSSSQQNNPFKFSTNNNTSPFNENGNGGGGDTFNFVFNISIPSNFK
ncbi:unnamed protein product [Meloidogyne enterolobii]|uniref:Uncharacterized protein n=1 Tax=Meloidogyne enterolobii TaxID=390850 RepID=A0ACB0YIZ4_MELEN